MAKATQAQIDEARTLNQQLPEDQRLTDSDIIRGTDSEISGEGFMKMTLALLCKMVSPVETPAPAQALTAPTVTTYTQTEDAPYARQTPEGYGGDWHATRNGPGRDELDNQ